jgi:hypothetical protein
MLSLSTQDREIKVSPAEHKAPHRRLHPPLLPLKTSVVGDNGSHPCSNRELEFNGRKPGSHRCGNTRSHRCGHKCGHRKCREFITIQNCRCWSTHNIRTWVVTVSTAITEAATTLSLNIEVPARNCTESTFATNVT